jgi:hypothetical protein
MQEHKNEYSIRKMDVSFRGVNQRVLPMGETGGVGKTEQGGRRTARPHPGDCATASPAVEESAGAGSAAEHLRETG